MVTVRSSETLETIVGAVLDPELPPVTIADLGILRSVEQVDGTVIVTVTPTYSGCPAVDVIEDDIRSELALAGSTTYALFEHSAPPGQQTGSPRRADKNSPTRESLPRDP